MANYSRCISQITAAAGRQLTSDEIDAIFERVHRAALDLKAGRVQPADVGLGKKLGAQLGVGTSQDPLIQMAAQKAAADLIEEARIRQRQAYLQVVKLGARTADVQGLEAGGLKPLQAVQKLLARDYSGRINLASLEQQVAGYKATFGRKLDVTWEALGHDFLGFLQDRAKLRDLVKELRGEDSGNALAKRGAAAYHDVAEEARQVFNAEGGHIGRLDDWGMPQHHSQERVAAAGKDAWIDQIMPLLDRGRYLDELTQQPWSDAEMRDFLGNAWDTIASNGHSKDVPGQFTGPGKRANQHAEHRQIHFKDADSVIGYWETFGERTAVEILSGHIDTMARDIAFIEHFGPNPNITYQTLRDTAVKQQIMADLLSTDPKVRANAEPRTMSEAVGLDNLYDYAAGRRKPTYRQWLRKTADGIAHANVFGKLGSSAITSFFGDKTMLEAVSHLNDLPMFQRWRNELSLLNPANGADRRALYRQGLMLDNVRSGLQRFGEDLGASSTTGKIANATMRLTGMQAINELRKGSFGLTLMDAIGTEILAGKAFADLADSDVRLLRNYGITDVDWRTWQLARLDDLGKGNVHVLTPEAISRIPDQALANAGIIAQAFTPAEAEGARRAAIVKLLGAVNTESEFAIVTPGWQERALFYGGLASQRGTVPGEIWRSVLQFKSFPWAFFQRGMDAVANMDGPASKAAMVAYIIASTTMAGAMISQTKEVLGGKDPRKMADDDWYKFWGQAFISGGALGFYGDFLYSVNQTRYGSGPIEALSGPTMGPLLELLLVQPLTAAKNAIEGKDTHLMAQTVQDLKGYVPGGNAWMTKTVLDHLIWQNVLESLSPGYLSSIRRRTQREYGQDFWWQLGETSPERAPNWGAALQ